MHMSVKEFKFKNYRYEQSTTSKNQISMSILK